VFAALTILLGIWIFYDKVISVSNVSETAAGLRSQRDILTESIRDQSDADKSSALRSENRIFNGDNRDLSTEFSSDLSQQVLTPEETGSIKDLDPEQILDDYISAWRNRDKTEIQKLWLQISKCESCLRLIVDQIVNHKLEDGLTLEVAIKMAALDTDIVLPVFDTLIDPAGSKSASIILSEKLINNGRPEFVNKIFDLIYKSKQNGYESYAQQLTWVISKLENPEGIRPILDTITGRKMTSPELATHVTNVYSKVVQVMPESSNAGTVIADYYLQANSQEQQRLWPVVSQLDRALVTLAIDADRTGQNYSLQKYAQAMSELPHLNAVNSLLQLHTAIEYSPEYMKDLLGKKVADNPTIKVLHRLEDYMRDSSVKFESRVFAAEGLLAIKDQRQARYILEKVISNTEEPDIELQAYIGGRL